MGGMGGRGGGYGGGSTHSGTGGTGGTGISGDTLGMARRLWGGASTRGGADGRGGTAGRGVTAVGHSPARRVCPPLRGAQRDRADPAGGERREVGAGIWDAKGGGRRWHRCRHAGSSPHLEAGRSGGTLLTSLSSGTLRGKWGGRGVREGGSGGGGAPVASVVRGEGGYGYSQWGRGDPEHRLHRPYRQHPAGGGGLRALRTPLGAGSAWG